MYSEVAGVLVFSETQVQLQMLSRLPFRYLSVTYDYGGIDNSPKICNEKAI